MFRSLRATISAFALLSLVFSSAAVMFFAVDTYETLYSESAVKELNGLSENLASDLIPALAGEIDHFAISTTLLRLNPYENIKLAGVYDNNRNRIQIYTGKNLAQSSTDEQNAALKMANDTAISSAPGVTFDEEHLDVVALKVVGDGSMPIGYLVLISDITDQLATTKKRFLSIVLPFVIAVVVLSTLWLLLMQSKVLKPLIELSDFTHEIRKTKQYNMTAKVKGKKEIVTLTRSFNTLMQAISKEIVSNTRKTQQLVSQQHQMERLANYDSLTGLPNRKYVIEKLRRELNTSNRAGDDLALLFFDLDGFKAVNDSHGHEVGDLLLVEVATALNSMMREHDTAARLGGDEFLVVVDGHSKDADLLVLARRIISNLSIPFVIRGWTIQVGVSVGIAKASDAGFDSTTLISNADIAMYASKLAGKGRATLFTQELMDNNKRKIQIAQAIPEAIETQAFKVYYQSKVDTNLNIVGYEALVRWHSADLGYISPQEFIEIAEQSGKINHITRFVIEQVCQDYQQLSHISDEKIAIAINLSVHDLRDESLVSFISNAFECYQVPAEHIEFEITESTYLENLNSANEFIRHIKALGCSIALDDFGTGYSSLGYLTRIDIDTLKIDKQFTDGIESSQRSRLITKTIIEMAKQLELKICAEGVEQPEQIDFLLGNGCHFLQGYYFSRPQPVEDIVEAATLNS